MGSAQDNQETLPASFVPARVDQVIDCEVDSDLILYTPEQHQGVSLNSSARQVWELCDGKRTLGQISQALGEKLGCPDAECVAELLADVEQTVAHFRKIGLLRPDAQS